MLLLRYPKIQTSQDLKSALQNAIRLEHATIPPYLTAWWTLKGTSPGGRVAQQVLNDIFVDEMHHMLAMCNLLNAIGGTPVLNAPGFVPIYPGRLPMTIGSSTVPDFTVGLRRYSSATIRNTFMVIEEPETPIEIPVATTFTAVIDDHYRTIGQFYEAVAAAIVDAGEGLFSHPSSPQITSFPVNPITDVASAVAAITLIREQGEGTPQSPLASPNTFAHYYRFESLARGMALVTTAAGVAEFDPRLPIVVDDIQDVIQMVDNPGQADLSQDRMATQLADEFDASYRRLLDKLHDAVNGDPSKIAATIAMMAGLSDLAGELLQHQISAGPQAGQILGPRFLLG